MSENGKVTALATRESVELDVADFRARMQFENERLKLMREFVSGQMVQGVHYGKIPGTQGKMTLLKPGAELLTNIHGLHPEFAESERDIDREATKAYEDKYRNKRERKGYVKYSFRCSLMKAGQKVGEGVGTCNNWERKYLPVDMDDAENTIMKMAKKRAFIDAVLTATRTSDFFTQDMEDKVAVPDDGPPADEPGSNDGPPPGDEAPVLSKKQISRIYAMAKAGQAVQNWTDADMGAKLRAVIEKAGGKLGKSLYDSDTIIPPARYEAICDELASWK